MDVASRIPNARLMRVSGNDYFGIYLSLDIADEIERFVAGEEAPSVPESVLAAVMFVLVARCGWLLASGSRGVLSRRLMWQLPR